MNVVSPAEPQWMLQFGLQRLGGAHRTGFGTSSCSALGNLHTDVDFFFAFIWKRFSALGAAPCTVLPLNTNMEGDLIKQNKTPVSISASTWPTAT